MPLTIQSFFSNYILKPWEAESPKERKLAWAASIILGVASACTIHAGCALVKYVVIPLAEKTGLTAKIDEIRERCFPDTNSFSREDALHTKETFDKKSKSIPIKEQTQQQGETKKAKEKIEKSENVPKKAAPTPNIPAATNPLPKSWEKAEANLRTSTHKDDLFTVALIDKQEFTEACLGIANQFANSKQTPKEKMKIYAHAWHNLMNQAEVLPDVAMSDNYKSSAHIAFWFILKKELPQNTFAKVQDGFTTDHRFDKVEDADEYANQTFAAMGLSHICYFENLS